MNAERFRLALVREPAAEPYGAQVMRPEDVAGIASALLEGEAQEVVLALHLDRKHRLRGYHEVARGSIVDARVDMQVLFAGVLVAGTPAFVLAHNHPSGETTPSADDIALTHRVKKAATLLGVEFVDHVIVGSEGWESLARQGSLRGE